jgi:hypothetical protein
MLDAPPEKVSAPERCQAFKGPEIKKHFSTAHIIERKPPRQDSGVKDAVGLVRFARNALHVAVIRLDDDGFECAALSDLYADAAGLITAWSGRHRPSDIEPVTDHIAASAVEWRRRNGRTY